MTAPSCEMPGQLNASPRYELWPLATASIEPNRFGWSVVHGPTKFFDLREAPQLVARPDTEAGRN